MLHAMCIMSAWYVLQCCTCCMADERINDLGCFDRRYRWYGGSRQPILPQCIKDFENKFAVFCNTVAANCVYQDRSTLVKMK